MCTTTLAELFAKGMFVIKYKSTGLGSSDSQSAFAEHGGVRGKSISNPYGRGFNSCKAVDFVHYIHSVNTGLVTRGRFNRSTTTLIRLCARQWT